MRVYYAFTIKNTILDYYKERSYSLYKILEQIYNLKNNDIVLGYNLLNEVTNPFKIRNLNNYIYKQYYTNENYRKVGENHILLSDDKETILKIYNSHVKIKSEEDYTKLFNTIGEYDKNIFVCDFINEDFFWVSSIINDKIVS